MAQNSAFIRGWPTAALVLGLALTVTWIGLLGYGAVALTELAFAIPRRLPRPRRDRAVGTTAADARQSSKPQTSWMARKRSLFRAKAL